MHQVLLSRLQGALGERFRIQREIEGGPFATVFLAADEGGHPVALNVVHPDLVAGAEDCARILPELGFLSRLRHPHVLPVLEAGEAADLLYYSTPFISGGSLRQRLETGPMPLADALRIAEEIAEALAYAHAHGVLHRALTTDNVLLEAGRAVVKDFWIARALRGALSERLTSAGMVVGTPGYMSPEQLSGESVDARSDVYSLAVLICEMLTNELPFHGAGATGVLLQQLTGPGPSPRDLPRTLPPGMAIALARAPSALPRDRFASARELVEACRANAIATVPAASGPVAPVPATEAPPRVAVDRAAPQPLARRWSRGWPLRLTLFAIAAGLGLVVIVVPQVSSPPRGSPGSTPALLYGVGSLVGASLVGGALLWRRRRRRAGPLALRAARPIRGEGHLKPRPAYESFERIRLALQYQYDVIQQVGRGGTSLVYLAHDLRYRNRKVAVKVLRPEFAASVMSERFLQEIEITAQLAHPAILPLLDSGDADGMPFYVMPFVEGETLKGWIDREGRLSLTDSLAVMRNVTRALDYAHRRQIVHRDIKPENILIHEGQATVADFGIALALARSRERNTAPGRSLGTPEFMSPEQFWDTANIDHRSDLYSLGCVLFEMLAGEPPYRGNYNELATRHLSAPIPHICTMRPDLPEKVDATLCRVLAKSPADRFDSALSFMEAL